MDLDLTQLAALSAAVSEGSFDAAARRLRITPSAVSQRIKALENSVGRVLVRRSKPVEATESGRVLLRLARQIESLGADVARELGDGSGDPGGAFDPGSGGAGGAAGEALPRVPMPIAVNADSLATWILPALAGLASRLDFDFYREDQNHTTALLREGTVMAAITSVAEPVQGCSSRALGGMRYRPMASAAFAARWFAEGMSLEALRWAPVVVFDRRDDLQDEYLQRWADRGGAERLAPPRHHVPASADFAAAVALGFGWGMMPELQSRTLEPALVDLDPSGAIDVQLYWQQWQLHTRALEVTAETIGAAAARVLLPPAP